MAINKLTGRLAIVLRMLSFDYYVGHLTLVNVHVNSRQHKHTGCYRGSLASHRDFRKALLR
jgi:hypothetical protein